MIRDKINSCKYKNSLIQASKYQDEITYYSQREETPFYSSFKNRVLQIYNGNTFKRDRFLTAFKSDVLPSLEIIDTIYNNLYKIFDSRDKVVKREVNTNDNYNNYISKFDEFWTEKAWKSFQTAYNSIVIVDTPQEQTGQYPESYPFLLDISKVKYIEKNADGEISEIIFLERTENQEIYYYYTDKFYSAYVIEGNLETQLFYYEHKLKECPAKFLLQSKLLSNDWVLRKNPTVNSSDDLFWYIFKSIESKKADLLYLNPDKQQPLQNCGFEKGNQKCIGGKLVDSNKQPILNEMNTQLLCPVCGQDKHGGGGAGNVYSIDVNSRTVSDGKVNPSAPFVHYISPDIDGVKEQDRKIIALKESIIKSVSGESKIVTKESVNEKQVNAQYNSQENILRQVADEWSTIIEWTEKIILKLRYGSAYKSNSYFMGSLFYTLSSSDLSLLKTEATNPIEKAEIEEQIIELKYKNNPDKLKREKLLYKLIPFPGLNDTDVIELYKSGKISDNEFNYRFNLTKAVDLFELEHGSIADFYYNFFKENVIESKRIQIISDMIQLLLTKKEENVQD